jgi:hypothetical protein
MIEALTPVNIAGLVFIAVAWIGGIRLLRKHDFFL